MFGRLKHAWKAWDDYPAMLRRRREYERKEEMRALATQAQIDEAIAALSPGAQAAVEAFMSSTKRSGTNSSTAGAQVFFECLKELEDRHQFVLGKAVIKDNYKIICTKPGQDFAKRMVPYAREHVK